MDLASNLELDLACLGNSGVISAYSAHDAEERVPLPTIRLMVLNGAVRFVYVYSMPIEAKKKAVGDITSCLQAGAYRPVIGRILPLSRTIEGHLAVEAGMPGKTLIRVVDD